MRKVHLLVAATATLAIALPSSAGAATAPTGPCAIQQGLFEKHNIQIDMYAPAVSWAYGTVCGITG